VGAAITAGHESRMSRKVTQQDLQDFVERRLAAADENRVLSYLRKRPDIEASTLKLRNQADLMRNLGRLILSEPVPPHLQSILLHKPSAANGAGQDARRKRRKRRSKKAAE
jgi:anti-sigma factor RsiW